MSITAATGAYYNAGTLYYKSNAAGSFSFSNALTRRGLRAVQHAVPGDRHDRLDACAGDGLDRPAVRLDRLQLDGEPDEPDEQDTRRQGRRAADREPGRHVRQRREPSDRHVCLGHGAATSRRSPSRSRLRTEATPARASTPGSGIVQRDEAPLDNSDGTCDAFPSSWATVTLSGGNDTTVVSGRCYRYRYLISDNVGNQGTQVGTSGTAKIDTSAPSAPTPLVRLIHEHVPERRGRLLPPQRGQRPVPSHRGRLDGHGVGLRELYVPGARFRLEHLAAPAPRARTATPARRPIRRSRTTSSRRTEQASTPSNVSFTVTPDSTGPSVTAPTVTAGYFTTTSVGVTLNGGTDGGSGVAAGSSVVRARRGAARQQRWNL